MNWFGGIARIALSSLRANKLRTVLTAVGVIIGIGTIIGMLSLINGINQSVMAEFKRLGPNVVYVTRHDPGLHVGPDRERERRRITLDEEDAISRRSASLEKISIIADARAKVGFRGKHSGTVTVKGVLADYADIAKVEMSQGRFFNAAEARRSRVCVLGASVVRGLFGKVQPLGKKVNIEGRDFEVVGTIEESGRVFGESSDDVAVIPYELHKAMFEETHEDYIMALGRDGIPVGDVVEDLRMTVRMIRKIPLGKEDGFAISTQESLLDTYKKLTGSIYWVMRIVASVALLVSGIGIMNIMLVVVMERTREVGLRKAIGATRRAILIQFLIEAIMMTLTGGIAGIGLGFLISIGVRAGTPLPASVPPWAVPLALGICCGVGIFFGFYPAARASALDPVKALRYE